MRDEEYERLLSGIRFDRAVKRLGEIWEENRLEEIRWLEEAFDG